MGFFDFFGLSAEDQLILKDAIKFLRENGMNNFADRVEKDTKASKHLVGLQKSVNKSNEIQARMGIRENRNLTLLDYVEGGKEIIKQKSYEESIIRVLQVERKKLTATKIDNLLNLKDISNVKIVLEKLSGTGEIKSTGNGRYHIPSDQIDLRNLPNYKVIMLSVDKNLKQDGKINAIKKIRYVFDWSLKESKDFVDNPSSSSSKTIKDYITLAEAKSLKDEFKELGIEVEIKKIKKTVSKDLILKILKDKATKMPASDIDAFLKLQNVDEVKELCEGMYHNGEISRTANYRYFILSEEEKEPKKASVPNPKAVDVKTELTKYKEMLDDGLIEQEDYDAKKKELLGL